MKRFFILAIGFLLLSCSGNKAEPDPVDPTTIKITIDPTTTYQEMIGFGGALTWYSNWMTNSTNKNQIADLIFTDLGIDIVRFKNWYYPDNYPTSKSTTNMSDDNSKIHWDATNELYTMAKSRVPGVKVLLSSWGPPAGLKSNGSTREGTLKRDASNNFMYDEFAQYWEDALDNIPFNPDYLSIQNEPTFTTSGWTTCKWSHSETAELPGYTLAFDKVYDKIKTRSNPPILIGPESQDIPTYANFADLLKTKDHCGALAYHPYNVNSGNSTNTSGLLSIAQVSAKMNMMTEFSDNLNWFSTAVFIQNTLIHANTSAYIYWKLVWAEPAAGSPNAGMISVTNNGQYTVTPFFYLIKHFSKNIDAGYRRISAATSESGLSVSAFINPDGNKVTMIVINGSTSAKKIDFEIPGKTISDLSVVQSKEGDYYKIVDSDVAQSVILPSQTVTTIMVSL